MMTTSWIMKKSLLLLASLVAMTFSTLAQSNCLTPQINEVKGAGTYCPGSQATLEVTGKLNDATQWTWYSDSCSGTVVGTGISIQVTITKTKNYFVKGTGGCVGVGASCTSVEVKIDDLGPVVTESPRDTVVANTAGLCGAVVDYALPKGEDTCSDTVFVKLIAGLAPGSFFPVGITEVKYELSDTLKNKTIFTFKVKIEDKELPVISCPKDTTANNEYGKCGAVVKYAVPKGTDNCPGVKTELTQGLGSGAFFSVGVTVETYKVTDASGNTTSCTFTVTVKDVELPVIKVRKKETALWPPNHKHHAVAIADYIFSVSDNCGGIDIKDVVVSEVGSDEPNNGKGDGNTWDDIVVTHGCDSTLLLAERSGTGNGRVYVVTMAVMDLHGNIGKASFNVDVPHDQGKKNQAVLDNIVYVVNGCELTFENETVVANPPVENSDGTISESETGSTKVKSIVYPNPSKGIFSLKFAAKANDHVTVEVYNMLGMKVAKLHEQDVELNKSYSWTLENPSRNSTEYILIIRGKVTREFVRMLQYVE
jgi:hypothetical protein